MKNNRMLFVSDKPYLSSTVVIFIVLVIGHQFQGSDSKVYQHSIREGPAVIQLQSVSGVFSSEKTKRSVVLDKGNLIVNLTILPDEGHNEAIVHWSGQESQAIFLLTRKRVGGNVVGSTLYRSIDYGTTFNVTIVDPDALLQYFYVCPNNKDKLIFIDSKNKALYSTTDEGSSYKKISLTVAVPDRLLFHPIQEDWILSYSEADRTLCLSKDLGNSWQHVQDMVNSRFFWSVFQVDLDLSTIHMEVEDSATGKFLYRAVKANSQGDFYTDVQFGYIEVGSLVVQNEYIFVQKLSQLTSQLYVSYQRRPFKCTHFPKYVRPVDFVILDTDDHQVFIAANHELGTVTLYLSDETGQFYVKSLDQVAALNQPEGFQIDLFEVKGLPGVYIANKFEPPVTRSYITFDQGGFWKLIPAPDKDETGNVTNCRLPDCSLYIHLHIDAYLYGITLPLSEDNAPGLILAQGMIGKKKEIKFLMSQDGGLTWSVAMNGTYRKSILDHGGAIVAVPDNVENKDITDVWYSCTDGTTWQKYTFVNGKKMKVDGLLNEPGINTLVASLYGHTSATKSEADSGWIIAKLDFSQILSRLCTKDDYDNWKPAVFNGTCVLGRKLVYEKRKTGIECIYGKDYSRIVSELTCSCAREDFECDFGYDLTKSGDDCIVSSWFDPNVPIEDCDVGSKVNISKGGWMASARACSQKKFVCPKEHCSSIPMDKYRKVASDKCLDSAVSDTFAWREITCPVIKPEKLSIQVVGRDVVATKINITFLLVQERGVQNETKYIWNFGDDTQEVVIIGNRNVANVSHVFKKTGIFVVSVTARNSKGSDSASTKIWVQDDLVGLYVSITHAAQAGKPTKFRAVPIFRDQSVRSTANVHYLWVFGDQSSSEKGSLTWQPSYSYTYNQAGNYTIWVEAFSGPGSVFHTIILPVYGTASTVKLSLIGTHFPYVTSVSTVIEDLITSTLRRVLAFELEIDASRLDVEFEFGQQMTPIVFVSVLPRQQTLTTDDSIAKAVDVLITKAKQKTIHFTLPEEIFGSTNNITITDASLVEDEASRSSSRLLGIAIGVPVLLLVCAACCFIVVYYRGKLANRYHYSVLHSRYRGAEGILDDTDDDDPMLDPNSGTLAGQRLTLSDDEDPLSAQILLRGTSTNHSNSDTNPVNC